MSEDWGDDELQEPDQPETDVAKAEPETFGVDVGVLAGQLVVDSVQAAVAAEVSKASQAAVKELMTPAVRDAIRARADEAASAAIAEQVDGPSGLDAEPELHYGSVDEFVREYLRHVYRRQINGQHRCWAGRWWEYDEAVIRLEALWRSWEHLRQDPATGMSVWWRDHADHHMAMLMDPAGPFSTATEGAENTARKGEPLPYVAPPAGMFPDVREEAEPEGDR